jgi:SOS response regulatory protein OraA/RecX
MGSPEQDALEVAGRALEHRDLSSAALRARLDAAGVGEALAEDTVARLVGDGLVDDARTASLRAQGLARRGHGNRAIDARLERDGFDRDCRAAALADLEPEETRAQALVGDASGAELRRLVAGLQRRGFGTDAIESALARFDAPTEPELR